MRSRIVALIVSVLLFLSSMYIVGIYDADTTASNTTVTFAENIQPNNVETIICTFENISYGNHEKQTFDLNLPVDNRSEMGLLVFIHGGGWKSGDKSSVKNSYNVYEANKYYATASINYRFVNGKDITVYDIIDDITAALQSIKDMAAGYNININKVILSGHSAGGHLALLYAYRYKLSSPIEPVGVFARSSVPDLTEDAFYTNNSLGDEKHMCELISKVTGDNITKANRKDKDALLSLISPINYVSANSVPTLILHGEKDRIAPYSGAIELSEKLSQYNINHELVTFTKSGHTLRKDSESKAYAESVMSACINDWFNITES